MTEQDSFVAAPKAERHLLSLKVGGFPWRDCGGSLKQANAGDLGTNLIVLSRFDGGVVRTNRVSLFA